MVPNTVRPSRAIRWSRPSGLSRSRARSQACSAASAISRMASAERGNPMPLKFDGFTILHISDMHVDMNEGAMHHLRTLLPELSYDICVLTGDYRGKTFGPFDAALDGLARVRSHLKGPVYGVLGNHDTICMVPELESMGIRMLLNESEPIGRQDEIIYLAGIDDAHHYRVDNIQKAASEIPDGAVISAGGSRRVRPSAEWAHPWWAAPIPEARQKSGPGGLRDLPSIRSVGLCPSIKTPRGVIACSIVAVTVVIPRPAVSPPLAR
jgi:calcineurin-like phosphoesterase family protein